MAFSPRLTQLTTLENPSFKNNPNSNPLRCESAIVNEDCSDYAGIVLRLPVFSRCNLPSSLLFSPCAAGQLSRLGQSNINVSTKLEQTTSQSVRIAIKTAFRHPFISPFSFLLMLMPNTDRCSLGIIGPACPEFQDDHVDATRILLPH